MGKAAAGLEDREIHPAISVKSPKQVRFGLLEWESIGEGIAVSILELHGYNPFSRLSGQSGLESLVEKVAGILKEPNGFGMGNISEDAGDSDSGSQLAQLYRVVYDQVVARDGPAVTRAVLDMFEK